jgi:hypothetical protein
MVSDFEIPYMLEL